MIIKINNKNALFYEYMGPIFGSRKIENRSGDRIYDDNDKNWYLYIKNNQVMACVSIKEETVKNVYGLEKIFLEAVFLEILNDFAIIMPSTVTNLYQDLYRDLGFSVYAPKEYNKFVIIDKA